MKNWEAYGILALLVGVCALSFILALKDNENEKIRSVQGPVLPVAQRSCCPTNEQPRLCTAPEKTAETPVLPTSPDAAAVKQDDDHLTKQLINGFFSPAAPGGIGGE